MDRSPGELLRGYAFLVPLVLFLAAFVLAPIAGTFGGSLMQDVTFLPERFVGAENYRALLSDPGFAQALRFTVLFTAASVPLELVLGLAVSLLLAHPSRARGALRACVLIPWAIPAAVSGKVFQLIYNYNYGLANYLMNAMGVVDRPVNWLGTSAGAFLSLVNEDDVGLFVTTGGFTKDAIDLARTQANGQATATYRATDCSRIEAKSGDRLDLGVRELLL